MDKKLIQGIRKLRKVLSELTSLILEIGCIAVIVSVIAKIIM